MIKEEICRVQRKLENNVDWFYAIFLRKDKNDIFGRVWDLLGSFKNRGISLNGVTPYKSDESESKNYSVLMAMDCYGILAY